ncbi:peptidoglycan-binding domain-containing protein [Methanosphaera cuniculi]|uniref:Putative peptidoglycan binding domain protein n=1 Tax=Methanosphaera cuniculi TaxID=1077256 RepID=A0A2A2HFJ7_9EURY|nr:peptidoglycan-binding protein [Methanosphaera cuniculi]PAV08125.1 hypothetical protein ASJ82_01270 [Methanosphaera cuniculi]PWL07760.1 putative peptidoglycan binding domain protein [Methanosphaera cuniculi]
MAIDCKTVNIRKGSIGEDVKTLQTYLSEKKLYTGSIDGKCEKYTVNAIKNLQKKYKNLAVDGVFGPITCITCGINTATPTNTPIDTGWKSPATVSQDSRWDVINPNFGCYEFNNLKAIKVANTSSSAYIPTDGGVKKDYHGPVVYVNNFGFNIPKDATIKEVYVRTCTKCGNGWNEGVQTKLLKLKTTASTTDFGVGKDISIHPKWPLRSWRDTTGGGTPEKWGVQLTPELVNSTNFGFVYQCTGTRGGDHGWIMPRIAFLQMRIVYVKNNTSTTSSPVVTPDFDLEFSFEDSKGNPLVDTGDEKNIYISTDPKDNREFITFVIKYIEKDSNKKYPAGQTPIVNLKSNSLKLSRKKSSTYQTKTLSVKEINATYDSDGKANNRPVYYSRVMISPYITQGECSFTVECGSVKKTFKVPVDVNIDSDTLDISDINLLNFMMDGTQRCIIHSCKFEECKAYAGASYATVNMRDDVYRTNNTHDYASNEASKPCKFKDDFSKCPHRSKDLKACPFTKTKYCYGAGYVDLYAEVNRCKLN